MSKLIIRKEAHSHRHHQTQEDTRSHLRYFLTTIKNHQSSRHQRLVSQSLNLSPTYFKGLSPPARKDNITCSLPAITPKHKRKLKPGINEFQEHIISNYLNAHLKVDASISTIEHKSKTKEKKKKKLTKVKEFKGSENTTIQEAQLQTLREDKREYNQANASRMDYSLKEEPMKHYVQERLERKKREWKEKSPLELVTYFYQLGPILQKEGCNPTLKHEKSIKDVKIQLPTKQAVPTFIKTYQPSLKELNVIQLIKKQTFTVAYEDNYLFFGEIKNKKRHGLGVLIKQGYVFQGTWKDDHKVKGIQKNVSGTYTGPYINDKKEGKGQFRWANGQLYSGEWAGNKKHGVGMWISPEGDSYMGEWKKGIVEGEGVHKCKSGQRYEGSFKNFLKHGWGKQSFPNGDSYQGTYCEGLPHGKGLYCWQNLAKYEGQFINGMRHGTGTLKNPKGFSFTGTFVQQFAQGQCQINYGNGDYYSGQLKKGKRNGKGILRQSLKRRVYDGQWKDDEFEQKNS